MNRPGTQLLRGALLAAALALTIGSAGLAG
jgi:hypothetical protein